MTYEVATGRPVYLPAPNMYTPRPVPQTFIPSHVHHRSTPSSEFAHPSPPPNHHNGFIDYSTGQSFFSFPRQTSRIEIRAPDSSKASGKSSLRTDVTAFEPSRAAEFFAPPDYNGDASNKDTTTQPPGDPPMVAYNPYQQYYYPEAYGYAPYMDMSQMGQYGMYPPDHIPQGTVFY
ncbi:hypothetical protein L218DRAFT_106792 [Marasmius fiardii PR-910]|nr:hypothetical protein L218DRAFT_106792 [Marasmius fiardii PR-910]